MNVASAMSAVFEGNSELIDPLQAHMEESENIITMQIKEPKSEKLDVYIRIWSVLVIIAYLFYIGSCRRRWYFKQWMVIFADRLWKSLRVDYWISNRRGRCVLMFENNGLIRLAAGNPAPIKLAQDVERSVKRHREMV